MKLAVNQENPYQPSIVPTEQQANASPRFLPSLFPAAVAILETLVLWIILVTCLDPMLPADLEMVIWSLTLLLSCGLATRTVIAFWPKATHRLAFSSAFAVFSIAFLLAEGDSAAGRELSFQMWFCCTLIVLPLWAYVQASRQLKRRPNTKDL